MIQPDNEVTIRIKLEVSNIASQITTRSGTIAYQIGTRTAGTVLKLKDGENQVLAGLISDDDRRSANKVPGLGDIPLLGRLFGQQQDNTTKREIVLSITPRIIRNIPRPELLFAEFDAGTEASLRNRGPEGAAAGASAPALAPGGGAALSALGGPGAVRATAVPPGGFGAPGASVAGPGATATSAPPQSLSTASAPGASGTPGPSGALAGAQGAPLSGGPTSLQWQGPAQARVGENISVALAITPGEAITGVPMAVGFDPRVLQITGITEGDVLKQNGGQTSFVSRVDAATGQAFVTVTRTSPEGGTQPGNLMVFNIRAVAPGQATLQLLSFAGIGLGGRSVAAPLPEPLRITISP